MNFSYSNKYLADNNIFQHLRFRLFSADDIMPQDKEKILIRNNKEKKIIIQDSFFSLLLLY